MVDGQLDREVKDMYLLNVIVQVGNMRLLLVIIFVNIYVLDRNDNFS